MSNDTFLRMCDLILIEYKKIQIDIIQFYINKIYLSHLLFDNVQQITG